MALQGVNLIFPDREKRQRS